MVFALGGDYIGDDGVNERKHENIIVDLCAFQRDEIS